MHRLRKLKFLVGILLFASPATLHAGTGLLQTTVRSSSSSGTANVDVIGPSSRQDTVILSIAGKTPPLFQDCLVLRGTFSRSRNDYRNVLLRDRFGRETSLRSQFDRDEYDGQIGADFAQGPHAAFATIGRNLSDSPFATKALNLGYSHAFFGGTTTVGASFASSRQAQPQTYFVDPKSFRMRERPRSYSSQREELFLEQVLHSRYKIVAAIFRGNRFEDRPTHWGAELRQGYALSDLIYARLDFGALAERKSQPLRDERGHFSVYWAEAQLSVEPVYDFLITAAYGTTVERERFPDSSLVKQVGTDSFGLKTGYRYQRWSFLVASNLSTSNTSYRSRSLYGEFSWEL